ncbi:MAG: AAA family ATPase [Alphaproteobacteria bacterium]
MLINFKFSNYKSFKDKVDFSMEPLTNNGSISNAIETGYKKAPCVYRTSAIFGANASGKSSFIHAVSYFQGLMEMSYLKRFNEQMEVPAYKLSDTEKNSTFEFEFVKTKWYINISLN